MNVDEEEKEDPDMVGADEDSQEDPVMVISDEDPDEDPVEMYDPAATPSSTPSNVFMKLLRHF
jgi:hypothetical protein